MKVVNSVFNNLAIDDYKLFGEKVDVISDRIQNLKLPVQSRIGVLAKRNIDTVATICAILKNDFVFVPIEETYSHSIAVCMLLSCYAACYIYDNVIEKIEIRHTNDAEKRHLAYIVHTSGTTGKPKGVAISIQNLENYILGFEKQFVIHNDDRFLISTSMAFDLSYTGLFLGLKNKCYIRVANNNEAIEPDRLLQIIDEEKITVLKITPSILAMMYRRNRSKTIKTLRGVRALVLGGERINVKHIEPLLSNNPGLTIINHYGPCETTIGCCMKIIDANSMASYKINTSIGKPFANNSIIIVDQNFTEVVDGKQGKLLIQGPSVGCGYINVEDDSNRFLMYNGKPAFLTSDIGFYNCDHELSLIGRDESVVKYKGYRISLGEITKQIEVLGCFSQIFVTFAKINNIDKLVCYYQSDDVVELKYLREHLKISLPLYMIPEHFIRVDNFVYNSNGKIDYDAIVFHKQNNLPIINPVEKQILEIWNDLTENLKIGLDDSFFLIGLDSLSELEFIIDLEDSFDGISLSHKVLLRFDTIRSLAQYILNYSTVSMLIDDSLAGVQTNQVFDYFNYYKDLLQYEQFEAPSTQKFYYRTGILKGVILNRVFTLPYDVGTVLACLRKWMISDCSLRIELENEQCKLFLPNTIESLPLVVFNIDDFVKKMDQILEVSFSSLRNTDLSFLPICISINLNQTLCIFLFNHNICKSSTIDSFMDIFSDIKLPDISHIIKEIKTYSLCEDLSLFFNHYRNQLMMIKDKYFHPLKNGAKKTVSETIEFNLDYLKAITMQIDLLFSWISACIIGKSLEIRFVPIAIWKNRSANTFLESYAWDYTDFEFYVIDTFKDSYSNLVDFINGAKEERKKNIYYLEHLLLQPDINYLADNIYLNIIHSSYQETVENDELSTELCRTVRKKLKKLKTTSIHGICIYGEIDDNKQNIRLCYSSNYDVLDCQNFITEFDILTRSLMENEANGNIF